MMLQDLELEAVSARTAAVSLAVRALIERLLLDGTVDARDLSAMRQFGLDSAADTQGRGTAGTQVENEVKAW